MRLGGSTGATLRDDYIYILSLTRYISDPTQAQPGHRRAPVRATFAARLVQQLGGTIYAGSLTKVVYGLALAAVELLAIIATTGWTGWGGAGLSAGCGNWTAVSAAVANVAHEQQRDASHGAAGTLAGIAMLSRRPRQEPRMHGLSPPLRDLGK